MDLIMPKMGKSQPPNTAHPAVKTVNGKSPMVKKLNCCTMESANEKNIKAHEEV